MAELVPDENAYIRASELVGLIALPMSMKAILNLGVLDIIAQSGPKTMMSAKHIVARLTPPPKDAAVAADYLDRMMRTLASHDIFTERLAADGCREYGLTPLCEMFKLGVAASFGPLLLVHYHERLVAPWHSLSKAVLEGELPIFRQNTMEPGSEIGLFNKAMAALSRLEMKLILELYHGLKGIGTLVDVGGGTGASLAAIKVKYPGIQAIDFDQPHVIARGDFAGIDYVGGDMFKEIPAADAVFIKRVLHDWSDEECVKILKNCYKAIPDNGTLIQWCPRA